VEQQHSRRDTEDLLCVDITLDQSLVLVAVGP
jgi:hypothetical protein